MEVNQFISECFKHRQLPNLLNTKSLANRRILTKRYFIARSLPKSKQSLTQGTEQKESIHLSFESNVHQGGRNQIPMELEMLHPDSIDSATTFGYDRLTRMRAVSEPSSPQRANSPVNISRLSVNNHASQQEITQKLKRKQIRAISNLRNSSKQRIYLRDTSIRKSPKQAELFDTSEAIKRMAELIAPNQSQNTLSTILLSKWIEFEFQKDAVTSFLELHGQINANDYQKLLLRLCSLGLREKCMLTFLTMDLESQGFVTERNLFKLIQALTPSSPLLEDVSLIVEFIQSHPEWKATQCLSPEFITLPNQNNFLKHVLSKIIPEELPTLSKRCNRYFSALYPKQETIPPINPPQEKPCHFRISFSDFWLIMGGRTPSFPRGLVSFLSHRQLAPRNNVIPSLIGYVPTETKPLVILAKCQVDTQPSLLSLKIQKETPLSLNVRFEDF